MNSINRNQPEETRANLQGAEAVEKLKELVAKTENCFFCTDGVHPTRPMNVRQVDERGHLWFLAASDSHWVQELATKPSVELFFQGSPHSDFLHVQGRAVTSKDSAKIKELWEPMLKNWFTEGVDDPRVAVIEVTPSGGYYWDTKHGGMVAGIKMLIGSAIDKTLGDSIEGTLNV